MNWIWWVAYIVTLVVLFNVIPWFFLFKWPAIKKVRAMTQLEKDLREFLRQRVGEDVKVVAIRMELPDKIELNYSAYSGLKVDGVDTAEKAARVAKLLGD